MVARKGFRELEGNPNSCRESGRERVGQGFLWVESVKGVEPV